MDDKIKHIQKRAEYIALAKNADFLDCVFYLEHYNRHVALQGPWPKLEDIKLQEILNNLEPEKYSLALEKVNKLFASSYDVGQAYYGRLKNTYDETLAIFYANNFGFSQNVYDVVINDSIAGAW